MSAHTSTHASAPGVVHLATAALLCLCAAAALAQPDPLAQAARGAALWVKNAPVTAHPFYWAGFSRLGR